MLNEHFVTRRYSEIIDEVEAATASITQPNSEEDTDIILNSVTLEHSAEQILNGIKRDVEVQYLVPMMMTNNDSEASQQSQQITQQTELQCPFKESGEDIVIMFQDLFQELKEINSALAKRNWSADFLNPVSKEVVAEECGLVSEGYLVTDLNPNALGLNIGVDPDIIESENLFGEELSFQFYELTSPSQLQSAWHTDGNGKVRFIVIDEVQIQNARSSDDRTVRDVVETEGNIPEREDFQKMSPGNEEYTMTTKSWSRLTNFHDDYYLQGYSIILFDAAARIVKSQLNWTS